MPGSISFLGLGSSQLNADLIDQLRTADEEIILVSDVKSLTRSSTFFISTLGNMTN